MGIIPDLPIAGGTPVVVFIPMSLTMRMVICQGFWFETQQQVALHMDDDGTEAVEWVEVPEGAVMRVDLSHVTGMNNALDWLSRVWYGWGPRTEALRAVGWDPYMMTLPLMYRTEEGRCLVAQMLRVVAEAPARSA